MAWFALFLQILNLYVCTPVSWCVVPPGIFIGTAQAGHWERQGNDCHGEWLETVHIFRVELVVITGLWHHCLLFNKLHRMKDVWVCCSVYYSNCFIQAPLICRTSPVSPTLQNGAPTCPILCLQSLASTILFLDLYVSKHFSYIKSSCPLCLPCDWLLLFMSRFHLDSRCQNPFPLPGGPIFGWKQRLNACVNAHVCP